MVLSATQVADLSTPEGDLQMSLLLVISKFDNELRKKKVIDGMRNKLMNGIYVHKPPYGYELQKIGQDKISVPNDKARFIKMAFELKASGCTNLSILNKLNPLGANLNIKRIGDLFLNPFYCGYIKGALLGNEIVKGIHEPIISIDTYEKVNNRQIKYGKGEILDDNKFPLKGFLKCEKCNRNWTGYENKKKQKSYYKCNTSQCRCNRNSDLIHEEFKTYLTQFHLKTELLKPFTLQLQYTFRNLNANNFDQKNEINNRKETLNNDLNSVNQRFGIGKIDEEVYQSCKSSIVKQLSDLDSEYRKIDLKISNPDRFVEFAVLISQNISKIWSSGSSHIKQSLQRLVFPTGVFYHVKNREYRTDKINTLFAAISGLAMVNEGKTKGLSKENPCLSGMVVPPRIELGSKV